MDRDSELIYLYREGDEDALVELVHRHINSVYNFVFQIVGNIDADDVTQESFVKAWKQLARFNEGERFRPWILAIARNTAIDRLRKRHALSFSDLDTDEEGFEATIPDGAPLPDAVFQNEAIFHEIEQALEVLPIMYKEVVVLHAMEDLTFEEIALMLDRPMNTVKSQYRRAIMELRKKLTKVAPK